MIAAALALPLLLLAPPPGEEAAIALAEARLVAAQDEPGRRREHLGTALGRLEEAAARSPEDAGVHRVLARVRLALNRPKAAAEAARRAVALAPDDPLPHVAFGEALLRLGDPEAAEGALGDAADRDVPRALGAALLRQKARARLRLGKLEAAAEDARRAVLFEPTNQDGEALLRWCRARLAGPKLPPHAAVPPALESAYAQAVPLATRPARAAPVYLLAPAAFGKLAPAGRGVRAFYQRDEMAVFVLDEKPPGVARLIAHEAFHAHMHLAVEDAPAWLDEGLGDWFAANPHPIRLRDLKVLLGSGHDVHFADLARRSRREMYDEEGFHLRFAAAWGWVHFLRAKHPARFSSYVGAVLDGASAEEAYAAAFGDTDVAALERAWRDYVLGLRLVE